MKSQETLLLQAQVHSYLTPGGKLYCLFFVLLFPFLVLHSQDSLQLSILMAAFCVKSLVTGMLLLSCIGGLCPLESVQPSPQLPLSRVEPRFIYGYCRQEESGSTAVESVGVQSVYTGYDFLLWLSIALNFILYLESYVWGLRKGVWKTHHNTHGLACLQGFNWKAKVESVRQVYQSSVGMDAGPQLHSWKEFQSLYLCHDSVLLSHTELQGKVQETTAAIKHCSPGLLQSFSQHKEVNTFCLCPREGSASGLASLSYSSSHFCASSARLGLIC